MEKTGLVKIKGRLKIGFQTALIMIWDRLISDDGRAGREHGRVRFLLRLPGGCFLFWL